MRIDCAAWLCAVIYWITSIPIAWVLWFKRLHNAAIKDRALTYAWFFLAYLLHIIWCIWSAICKSPQPCLAQS